VHARESKECGETKSEAAQGHENSAFQQPGALTESHLAVSTSTAETDARLTRPYIVGRIR
jgi:hypothetical protein